MSDDIFICKICNTNYSTLKSLSNHLSRTHKIKYKDYFNQYIEPWFHKCPYCNRERLWKHAKYNKTCGNQECLIKSQKDGYANSNIKRKETCLKKFGHEYPAQAQIVQNKMKNTMIERYGVENALQSDSIKNKVKETMIERYGVEYAAQNKDIYEKVRTTQTNLYGGIGFASSELFNKHKLYCLKILGCEFPLQNDIICRQQQHNRIINKTNKYCFNEIKFDSQSELLFYKYCCSNNFNIIIKPEPIKYIDSYNIEHLYFPDFKINNKLYEIKGKHFFNKNNEYQTPWKQGLNENEINKRNSRDEAKYKCMLDNNVIIVLDTEVQLLVEQNPIELRKKLFLL